MDDADGADAADDAADAAADGEREAWDSVAPAWHRWWRTFEDGAQVLNERLVAMAAIASGHRVLDVATGIGEPALTAARAVGPKGHVLATDLSGEMLRFARSRATAAGFANVEFLQADAQQLDAGEAVFDAGLCRWGLMLIPDPVAAARRAHAALRDGARFATAVWSKPEAVPFLAAARDVLSRELDLPAPEPDAPGPFRLQEDNALPAVLHAAGFRNIRREQLTVTMRFASPAAYAEFITEMSSVVRKMLAAGGAARRSALLDAIARHVADRAGSSGQGPVKFENLVLCAVGMR